MAGRVSVKKSVTFPRTADSLKNTLQKVSASGKKRRQSRSCGKRSGKRRRMSASDKWKRRWKLKLRRAKRIFRVARGSVLLLRGLWLAMRSYIPSTASFGADHIRL